MRRTSQWAALHAFVVCAVLVPAAVLARPITHSLVESARPPDIVGPIEKTLPATQAVSDTVWFVEWTFDSGGACDASGWEVLDKRVLNDGSNYWQISTDFDAMGGIAGNAAVLAKHDPCWVFSDGYGNNWNYAIVCDYTGTGATLSFDYLLDAQDGGDSLIVEADQLCSAEQRVDYSIEPGKTANHLRIDLTGDTGVELAGSVLNLPLPDFGAPQETHCVYIRFQSNDGASHADGIWPTTIPAGLVVDNISVTGGLAYTENFEGGVPSSQVSFVNAAPSQPFGLWARLFPHATDNDACTENTTCAWIFSDPTLPAYTPDMAFGPSGVVVRNWLDNVIVSPWVSLPRPFGVDILFEFFEFPGNEYSTGRIVRNWSWRGKTRVDTGTPGDSVDCVSAWGHVFQWNSLPWFNWRDRTFSGANNAFDPSWEEVQVRFRVSDWQHIVGAPPPSPLDRGPGPYIDHVRLGHRVVNAPVFANEPWDRVEQAQDRFASTLSTMSGFENYTPSTDRFGTADFSMSREGSFNCFFPDCWFKRPDSIVVEVVDVRQAGITNIEFHGAIVAGPHAGKSPPPWTVGPNGFFAVPADTSRLEDGSVWENHYFVDLDDQYFRGGDVLYYFWTATDAGGGFASFPKGMSTLPASLDEAETATGGLFEVSFLPGIDWDPAYVARIAADPHGKVEPTPTELANSRQTTCILYDQMVNGDRRPGPAHRTSFMYTLDKLGYAGHYDVYDHTGLVGTANNQIAGRATVAQATQYALIVLDAGFNTALPAIPDGSHEEYRFDQSQWYRNWLAQAATSEAGTATLWILGPDLLDYATTEPLLINEMGIVRVSGNQSLGLQPDLEGQTSFTAADGTVTDFAGDLVHLDGGSNCVAGSGYDAAEASGTAVVTHRYRIPSEVGEGAVVMNANASLAWNTVYSSFWWRDLRNPMGAPIDQDGNFARKILNTVLPDSCQAEPDPTTGAGEGDGLDSRPPRVTALYSNAPNPFNPITTIHFDLARGGHVDLRIYDAAGRHVRTLVDQPMPREHHTATWDGMDDNGNQVSSGLYFYRLTAGHFTATRKMVVLR